MTWSWFTDLCFNVKWINSFVCFCCSRSIEFDSCVFKEWSWRRTSQTSLKLLLVCLCVINMWCNKHVFFKYIYMCVTDCIDCVILECFIDLCFQVNCCTSDYIGLWLIILWYLLCTSNMDAYLVCALRSYLLWHMHPFQYAQHFILSSIFCVMCMLGYVAFLVCFWPTAFVFHQPFIWGHSNF